MPAGLISETGSPADVSGLALEDGGNLAITATQITANVVQTTLSAAVLGVTTGAKVVTDAAGTLQQYLRGLTVTIGSTGGAAIVTDSDGSLQEYLRGLVKSLIPVLGTIAGAAVVTDINGSVQQYLRGVIAKGLPDLETIRDRTLTVGPKTTALSYPVTTPHIFNMTAPVLVTVGAAAARSTQLPGGIYVMTCDIDCCFLVGGGAITADTDDRRMWAKGWRSMTILAGEGSDYLSVIGYDATAGVFSIERVDD